MLDECLSGVIISALLSLDSLGETPLIAALKAAGVEFTLVEQAITATNADRDCAAALRLPMGSAVLRISGLFCAGDGRCIMRKNGYFLADNCNCNFRIRFTAADGAAAE